jgi:hypothetical protein
MSNFMNIHPVGAELFHAGERKYGRTDGRTYMTTLIVAFHNFANTSKKTKSGASNTPSIGPIY